jgi:hypothetical protein
MAAEPARTDVGATEAITSGVCAGGDVVPPLGPPQPEINIAANRHTTAERTADEQDFMVDAVYIQGFIHSQFSTQKYSKHTQFLFTTR